MTHEELQEAATVCGARMALSMMEEFEELYDDDGNQLVKALSFAGMTLHAATISLAVGVRDKAMRDQWLDHLQKIDRAFIDKEAELEVERQAEEDE